MQPPGDPTGGGSGPCVRPSNRGRRSSSRPRTTGFRPGPLTTGASAGQAGIVDQVSFVVMRRLGLDEAFTNDRHFQAAGFATWF